MFLVSKSEGRKFPIRQNLALSILFLMLKSIITLIYPTWHFDSNYHCQWQQQVEPYWNWWFGKKLNRQKRQNTCHVTYPAMLPRNQNKELQQLKSKCSITAKNELPILMLQVVETDAIALFVEAHPEKHIQQSVSGLNTASLHRVPRSRHRVLRDHLCSNLRANRRWHP